LSQAPGQVSARSAILASAIVLIAEGGERAATFRGVAEAAGVSHSLLQHHFGTKQGLIAAVEDVVVERFSAALATTTRDPEGASDEIAAGLSELIAGDPQLRGYLRRALLEATRAGQALFGRIVDLAVQQLKEQSDADALPTGAQLTWLAVEVVAVNLAGVIFEPMLARALDAPPFAADVVAWRTEANRHFMVAALGEYWPGKARRR
jgi:AcrR family transcriptional regulator